MLIELLLYSRLYGLQYTYLLQPLKLDFFSVFIDFFRERGGEKGEGEKNINWLPPAYPLLMIKPAPQACVLTGNPNGDLSVHGPILN